MFMHKKYIIVLIISLILPALFMYATKDIEYKTPDTNPVIADSIYTYGKGWPFPIYEVTQSGGFTGETTGPNTYWHIFIIEYLVLFLTSFAIGTLTIIISNNLKQKNNKP